MAGLPDGGKSLTQLVGQELVFGVQEVLDPMTRNLADTDPEKIAQRWIGLGENPVDIRQRNPVRGA